MSELNISEQQAARAIMAKINAPLDAAERQTCVLMGVEESVFLAERNRALEAKLPGSARAAIHGLTPEEAHVADTLGITLADFAAEKKKIELSASGRLV